MKSKHRQKFIMDYLIKSSNYVTLNDLALECNVSSRTINNDLESIKAELLRMNYSLIKKRGVGIKIIKNEGTKVIDKVSPIKSVSKSERMSMIMHKLLIEERVITYEGLTYDFNISASSLREDIKSIAHILSKNNNLVIKSDNNGTRVYADDIDTLIALENYVHYVFNSQKVEAKPNITMIECLEKLFDKYLVYNCIQNIDKYIVNYGEEIIEYYYQNLLLKMIILCFRVEKKHHLNETSLEKFGIIQMSKEENSILKDTELDLNIKFNDSDTKYLNFMMYLLHFKPIKFEDTTNELTIKFVKRVSEILDIDLMRDFELLKNLNKHLKPMLMRIRSKIVISNPFNIQIKLEMSTTYNTICVVLSEMDEIDYDQLNENEIGYLTLHIQAAIEKSRSTVRVLIVCQNGISTSNILINRLRATLPICVELGQTSYNQLKKMNLGAFDLVISTTSLDIDVDSFIKVGPLLNAEDKTKILNRLGEKIEKVNSFVPSITPQRKFTNFFKEEMIFTDIKQNDMVSALKSACTILKKEGYITDEYIGTVLSREKLGGTEFQFGVAIPHGNPEYVKESIIAIMTSSAGLNWNGTKVNFVFLLCIDKRDISSLKEVLFVIDELIKDRELISTLAKRNNREEIYEVLTSM